MKQIVSFLFLVSGWTMHLQAVQDTTIQKNPEIAAGPPGGIPAYLQWLDMQIHYSDSANIADVKGKLTAEFVVERGGELTNIRIVGELGYGTEEAVKEAIATSRPWKPGLVNGRSVRSLYRMPVEVNVRQAMDRKQRGYGGYSVANVDAPPPVHTADTTVLESVEVLPEPPGGMRVFMQWVGKNYRIPRAAIDAGVSGEIQVSFIVEVDGTISNVEVLKDLGHGTGSEAIRLLRRSPKWQPGISNGRPVRVRFNLPIRLLF